jgi:hypothetical protein
MRLNASIDERTAGTVSEPRRASSAQWWRSRSTCASDGGACPLVTTSAHAHVACHTSGATASMSSAPASTTVNPSSTCASATSGRRRHSASAVNSTSSGRALPRAGGRPGQQLDGLQVGRGVVEVAPGDVDAAAGQPHVQRGRAGRPQVPRLGDRALGLGPLALPEQRVGGVGEQGDARGTGQAQLAHALQARAGVGDALFEPVQRPGEQLGAAHVSLDDGLRLAGALRHDHGLVEGGGARGGVLEVGEAEAQHGQDPRLDGARTRRTGQRRRPQRDRARARELQRLQ